MPKTEIKSKKALNKHLAQHFPDGGFHKIVDVSCAAHSGDSGYREVFTSKDRKTQIWIEYPKARYTKKAWLITED